ncbi:MAG: ATP-binding cassette domain-containing protein [Polyangiales bacterium]
MAILAYENVSKSFGKRRAVEGVDLEVLEGEVLGLLGPNGAGKTTLIRMAFDIIRPDSGELRLFGAPLTRSAIDRVSYLPEERGLSKNARVIDMMVYLGRLKGLKKSSAKSAARSWLRKFDLDGVEREPVNALSKGMSQKVQIASCLMTDPELCVLDEPFSGLDPVNAAIVEELILERKKNGQTTVLSTHRMNQVEALCDRVALIHKGERVVYGALSDVRARYGARDYFVGFDGVLPALSMVQEVDHGDQFLRLRLSEGYSANDLLSALIQHGNVRHFERAEATMDEIFVSAVRGNTH